MDLAGDAACPGSAASQTDYSHAATPRLSETAMPTPIDPVALASLMESDTPHAVLDVRPRADYVAAQLFGSTTVPRPHLEARLGALVPVRRLQNARESSARQAASGVELVRS